VTSPDHDDVIAGSDGRFTIVGVEHATVLSAHTPTAAAGPVAVPVAAPVTLRLHAGVVVEVEVVSIETRQPIAGARGTLVISGASGLAGQLTATADAHGVLRFPAAPRTNFHVVAEADGFAPTTRMLTAGDHDGLAWHQVLALEPGVVIAGRVVDDHGAAVAGATISATPAPRDRTVSPYRPGLPDRMRPPVITSRDGTFRYAVPTNQALVLVAKHPRFRAAESPPIVAAAPEQIELRLGEGRSVRGRVVDGDGAPIAGATVTDREHSATTDAGGAFELTGFDPRQAQTMIIAHDTRRSSSPVLVALPDGFATPIELRATHTLELPGTVVDAAGAPVADAIVTYRRRIAPYKPAPPHPVTVLEPTASGEIRADADGAFTIGALAAGDYDVTARNPTSGVIGTTVVAHAGEATLIQLAATVTVRGRAITTGGAPITSLDVAVRDFRGDHHLTADDGRFTIDDLDVAAGKYVVRLSGDGIAARELEVPVTAPGTVELGDVVFEPGRTLHGVVRDSATSVGVWNAVVTIAAPDGSVLATTRSDDLGRFSAGVARRAVVVHAAVGGVGGSRFVTVAADRDELALRLPETGHLDVSVAGVDDPAQVSVTASRTEPGDGGFRNWILDRDASGSGFHGELSPGHYLVRAGAQPRFAGGGVAITIQGGEQQHVNLSLGPAAP